MESDRFVADLGEVFFSSQLSSMLLDRQKTVCRSPLARKTVTRAGWYPVGAMDDEDEICLCFHVSKRALRKFVRLEKPVKASQLSQCYGAGTGCGWCRPFLERIFNERNNAKSSKQSIELTAEEYAAQRAEYRKKSPKKA